MTTLVRVLSALPLALVLASCGSTEPDLAPAPLDRIWRASQPGLEETTLELASDGSVRLVEADYAGRSCTASAGTWTSDGSRLELRLTPPGGSVASDVRTFDYQVSDDKLVLARNGAGRIFARATGVPSCVSYGFGTWTGTLSARINDVPWVFSSISVDAEGVRAGTLEIVGCLDTATVCQVDNAVLLVRVNATSGSLTPGSYPLGDITTGFYGRVNLFPDDPVFPGFDSLRLLPTGAIQLVSVSEDRIVATFEFRANERASNAPPAPDGSTFALVSQGIIDLQYR